MSSRARARAFNTIPPTGGGGGTAPVDIAGSPSGASSFAVTWDESNYAEDGTTPAPTPYGYAVQFGDTDGGPYPYQKVLIDATTGPNKTVTVTGLQASHTWYAVVRSVGAAPGYELSRASGQATKTT